MKSAGDVKNAYNMFILVDTSAKLVYCGMAYCRNKFSILKNKSDSIRRNDCILMGYAHSLSRKHTMLLTLPLAVTRMLSVSSIRKGNESMHRDGTTGTTVSILDIAQYGYNH